MKVKSLRKDEIKDLQARIGETLGFVEFLLPRGCRVEVFSSEKEEIYVVDGEPEFFIEESGAIIPLLSFLLKSELPFPRITVDMKAVPHLCNGADVFRGGVTQIDPVIKKGQTVVVTEEKNKKPICVGRSLMDASDMQKASGGKVILNIHFVGDDLWNFSKTLVKR